MSNPDGRMTVAEMAGNAADGLRACLVPGIFPDTREREVMHYRIDLANLMAEWETGISQRECAMYASDRAMRHDPGYRALVVRYQRAWVDALDQLPTALPELLPVLDRMASPAPVATAAD